MNYEVTNIRKIKDLDTIRVLYKVEAEISDEQKVIFNKDLDVIVNTKEKTAFPDSDYLKEVIGNNEIRRTLFKLIRETVQAYINKSKN